MGPGVAKDAEDAEIVGRGAGGVGVDARVEYGAGDARGAWREGEGADVAKVLRVGERSRCGADGGECARLEEKRGKDGEGLQAVASRVRRMKDRCGRGCFPMG